MNSNLAASTATEDFLAESTSTFDDDFARDVSVASLFASWPAPAARPPSSRVREVYLVVALSAFLHAGLAAAAFQPDHDVHRAKRLSRVEVELTRAPSPPKPLIQPVVPPPTPKPEIKPLAAAPRNVVEAPAAPTPPVPSNDTGSSSPAAEDGELYAGSGGLGTAAPPPPAPPPLVAPAKAAEPVIQAREGANYLKNPRPSYPRLAKREGWEGTTLLRVQVQASGKPGAVKVQKSSGRDVLDEAAVETVTQWTFVPATQGGTPVAGSVLVPIVFRLQ